MEHPKGVPHVGFLFATGMLQMAAEMVDCKPAADIDGTGAAGSELGHRPEEVFRVKNPKEKGIGK
jgi:hypothetical protein